MLGHWLVVATGVFSGRRALLMEDNLLRQRDGSIRRGVGARGRGGRVGMLLLVCLMACAGLPVYLLSQPGAECSEERVLAAVVRLPGSVVDGRGLDGQILDAVPFEPVVPGFNDRIFSLPIWVKPHAYKVDVEDVEVTVSGTSVPNPCTAESEPIITVAGSGDITLVVGEHVVELDAVDQTITLDCDARVAHKGGVLAGSKVSLSEWPVLVPGENLISWTGIVYKVTISPRWRWA